MIDKNEYGVADNSYQAANGIEGIIALVELFYQNMDAFKQAQGIRNMHRSDLTESKQKLSYFLSGWLGGPKLYSEHYGSINIPAAHQSLPIGNTESEAWLYCMDKAIQQQPYQASFKQYLIEQLTVPAERIVKACAR
jgi:hemoglobin